MLYTRLRRRTRPTCLALVFAAAACVPAEEAPPDAPIVVAEVGFQTPESMQHDAVADVYLVSNINGSPLAKDDNGFVSRLSPAGDVLALKWIDGEAPNVTLHAPKGIAVRGDTIFVADIDTVRLFSRSTGAPQGGWGVPGATFLNDVAVGPDGALYVTDSGFRMGAEGFEPSGTDAVYRFDQAGVATAIVRGADLGGPNGVLVESAGITVVTFGSGEIYRVDPATRARSPLVAPGGQLDGVVRAGDGSLLISSWADSSVHRLSAAGEATRLVSGIPSPADIGYDAARGRLLIPVFTANRVEIRPVP